MADKALVVKITADVTTLPAQLAVAKTGLASLNANVRDLAKEFAAASVEMRASLAPELDKAAVAAVQAKMHVAELAAEVKALQAPIDESGGLFASLTANAGEAVEKIEALTAKVRVFEELASSVSEFVIAGLGVEAVAESINRVAETGEKLDKLSEETGLSTEQLSALRVMAISTGTDFDQFTSLILRLPNTLQDAVNNPASKAAEAFRAMGVQVKDTQTGAILPLGDILDQVSAKLATYKDGANKTALETDIFGSKIGAELIPMLDQLGQVGLQGAIEKSSELAQTWTGPDAEAASQFEEDLKRVGLGIEGIATKIITVAIPALNQLAQAFSVMTGTASVDDKIANLQSQLVIAEGGGRFSEKAEIPHIREEIAAAEAQKAQLTQSVAAQAAFTGGAAPESVDAPNVTKPDRAAGGDGGVSSAKEAQDQITEIAQDGAQARKQIATAEYDAQVSNWDAEVSTGKMSKTQELQDEIDAKNKMYQADLAEAQQEVALAPVATVAKAKALDDLLVLQADHNAQMAKLNDDLVTAQAEQTKQIATLQEQAAAATTAAWQKAFAPVTQAFDTSINGIIQGTQTMQSAELKAAQSITLAFIDSAAKKVEAYVVSDAQMLASAVVKELGITAAVTTGAATQLAVKSAATSTGKAIDAATSAATINNNAATAASGAYAAVAAIPIVGPVLAPEAGAAAYAAVLAYDVLSAEGGLAVPAGVNPLVQLHENETVLPAYIAQPLTSMLAGNTMNDQSSGDTSITNNFNNTYHGAGNLDEDAYLAMLNSAVRSGRLMKYPAIARMMRR